MTTRAAPRKPLSKALLAELATEARDRCALCGKFVAIEERSFDHRVPLSCGGSDDRANLQLAHQACNRARKSAPYERPRRRLPELGAPLPRFVTERQLQAQVEQAARLLGWQFYHTHDSRHSVPGFPDLVLIRPPEVLFAELKTMAGKLSREQIQWRDLLTACGMRFYLWRPDAWDEIEAVLR